MIKRCQECNMRQDVSMFHKMTREPDGLNPRCKVCVSRRAAVSRSQRADRIPVLRQATIERNQRWILAYLMEHPCVDCGEADPIVLEFDHVRGTKRRAVGVMVLQGWALRTLQAEVAKCDVRCANCHRRITHLRSGGWRARLSEFTNTGTCLRITEA